MLKIAFERKFSTYGLKIQFRIIYTKLVTLVVLVTQSNNMSLHYVSTTHNNATMCLGLIIFTKKKHKKILQYS